MTVITISRAAFSGVETLAETLAAELGYRLYSREELLSDAARQYNALQSELESALIHKPGLLEGRGVKKLRFVQCVRATIARAVRGDDIVYHGEAGHLLLGPIDHHLRVRAVVPNETRVANAMERCDMSRERATQYLADLDEKRSHWVKWMHGVDMNDPHTFDLMLNLGRIPATTATRLIADTARRDFRTTPESQKTLDDLALQSEIRARVGVDEGIPDDRFDILVDGGVVTIRTTPRFMPDASRAGEIAATVAGVTEVRSELKE